MNNTSYLSDIRSEYENWLNKNNEILTKIFTWAMIIDNNTIESLNKINEQKKSFRLLRTMGNIPNFSKLNVKQKMFIPKWQKNVYRGDYLICRAIRQLKDISDLRELQDLEKRQLDPYLKESLVNARKLHLLGFFDASIILCGKITEYILKEKMNKNSIRFEEKWGILKLFNRFQSTQKQPKQKKEMTKNVQEIIRNLRNLYAHENPKLASAGDSNLVWHSLLYLINELKTIQ
ncbi:MAG: hypothetical protein ACFFB5_01905 [Promethearchaeota archaeon]